MTINPNINMFGFVRIGDVAVRISDVVAVRELAGNVSVAFSAADDDWLEFQGMTMDQLFDEADKQDLAAQTYSNERSKAFYDAMEDAPQVIIPVGENGFMLNPDAAPDPAVPSPDPVPVVADPVPENEDPSAIDPTPAQETK